MDTLTTLVDATLAIDKLGHNSFITPFEMTDK